jgi:NAD(P)-dependent dehydrogenase (short-subunit alcohol dehydrogenase family)
MRRTLLITGSSRGLGRALAARALADGHQVVATARAVQAGADLVENNSRCGSSGAWTS